MYFNQYDHLSQGSPNRGDISKGGGQKLVKGGNKGGKFLNFGNFRLNFETLLDILELQMKKMS